MGQLNTSGTILVPEAGTLDSVGLLDAAGGAFGPRDFAIAPEALNPLNQPVKKKKSYICSIKNCPVKLSTGLRRLFSCRAQGVFLSVFLPRFINPIRLCYVVCLRCCLLFMP